MSDIAPSIFLQVIWASDDFLNKMGTSLLNRRLAMIEEQKEKEQKKNTKLNPEKLVSKL